MDDRDEWRERKLGKSGRTARYDDDDDDDDDDDVDLIMRIIQKYLKPNNCEQIICIGLEYLLFFITMC